jgi:ribosomal protein L30
MAASKIFVKQVRSTARTKNSHKKTLAALGLGRIGNSNVMTDNPAVRGMLRAVIQWIEVKHV